MSAIVTSAFAPRHQRPARRDNLTIRVSRDELAELSRASVQRSESVSDLVRRAIRHELDVVAAERRG